MIRPYVEADYPIIARWWVERNLIPSKQMLSDTTFILESNNTPQVCASLLLTNCKGLGFIENVIAEPSLDKNVRREFVKEMFSFLETTARNTYGCKTLCLFSQEPKLDERYLALDYKILSTRFTGFFKHI